VVVSGRVWKETTSRWQFLSKMHGRATANKRGLEARKAKDKEGNLVTDGQRDTMIKAKKDCRFEYTLSYKVISNRSNEKEYTGTLRCLGHTHPINFNSFSFKVHETGTMECQTLIGQARKYRIGNLSYLEGQVLLEQEHQGLILNQKTYYNLLRKKLGDANNPDTITALLKELQEAGIVYRTRTKDEVDANGRVIKRKLIQIIFFHREVIRFAWRFIAGKLLVVDGTFNTEKLRPPLLIGVGITNSGKTFPCASSYCPGGTAGVL
jgi:hypothetical protein